MMIMRSQVLGEFAGTTVLMLLGCGANAGVMLKRSKAEGSGWLVITTAWAFAVMSGIFTAILFGSPDAHLNPAITLAFAIEHKDFTRVLPFAGAQMAGAFLGAGLAWLCYFPHWALTEDAEAKRAAFCTFPAVRSYGWNLLSEGVATFVLILVAGSISSKLVLSTGTAAGLSPYLVSCVIWGIGLSLGGTTGYAINPARDFGSRLAHAILPIAGKTNSDWDYAWVPILGPLLGASCAGLLLRLLGA